MQIQGSDRQMDYLQTMDFIKNLTTFGINLGLNRIRELLKRLDNPQTKIRVIHIGGTNGKGSTSAILQSILKHAGNSVGMFSSPHLNDYRERIRINDELISPEDVVEGISIIRPVLEEMLREGLEHPTEFEVSTALALLYFAEKQPDFVIMEVGLGGEIDSTNVVWPLISVLTSIGMDHMDYLGNSIEEITRVKAGIIKKEVPVVTSADKPESLQIIEEVAGEACSRLIRVGQDITLQVNKEKHFSFNYRGLRNNYDCLELSLYGEHQFVNAATAIGVYEILCDYPEKSSFSKMSETAVREGLENVRWPGRLELVSENPKILIDGAHNVDGMKTLAKALVDYSTNAFKRNRLILCFGMLGDKEIEKALEIILPMADEIIVTKPDSPRAGDWKYLASLALRYLDSDKIHIEEDPIRAAREGLKRTRPGDMLCITGSLYMLAPVRKYLLEHPVSRI